MSLNLDRTQRIYLKEKLNLQLKFLIMKYFLRISVFLILYSCSNIEDGRTQVELYSNSFISSKTKNNIGMINLDTVESFSELRKAMGKLTCEKRISGLRFEINDSIYNLIGYSDCPISGEIGCHFTPNILNIRNDSLILGHGKEKYSKPISYLKQELNNIIESPYRYYFNEERLKPAVIYFYVDDKQPMSVTKKVLKEIVEEFLLINNSKSTSYFEYSILFIGYDITKLPPPPPPPTE